MSDVLNPVQMAEACKALMDRWDERAEEADARGAHTEARQYNALARDWERRWHACRPKPRLVTGLDIAAMALGIRQPAAVCGQKEG